MKRFFYVYIPVSETDDMKHYTGITRFYPGVCRSTIGSLPAYAKYKPWRVETAVALASETKARAFEKYLKSGSGREFARLLVGNNPRKWVATTTSTLGY